MLFSFEQLRKAFGIPSETYYDWKEKLENGYYQTKTKQQRRRKIDKEALKQAAAVFYAFENLNMTRKKGLYLLRKNSIFLSCHIPSFPF